MTHAYTSPYHSKLNGGVESSVRSVKHCLTRDSVNKVTQEMLGRITFSINSHLYNPGDPKVVVTEDEETPSDELEVIGGIANEVAMVERTDNKLFNQIYCYSVKKQKML